MLRRKFDELGSESLIVHQKEVDIATVVDEESFVA